MVKLDLVSTDSHVVEPPDLWSSRLRTEWGDRAPHIESDEQGDWWHGDGVRLSSVIAGVNTGMRFEHPEKLRGVATFPEVRQGGYVPSAKIADMDSEGVFGDLVYPTAGLFQWNMRDGDLFTAATRCYNDWSAEFCSAYPDRLKGIAMINLDSVEDSVAELERIVGIGMGGAMVSVYPGADRAYDKPLYDPFWAAAQDLRVPVHLHAGTNRRPAVVNPSAHAEEIPPHDHAYVSALPYWVQLSVAHLIFGGVFERFPKLDVVVVEHELGWIPHFLRSMDYTYTQRPHRAAWHRFDDASAVPSDFFHRNVWVSFQEDPVGMQLRSLIGVDHMMWGSDYPHTESTFPRTRQILDRIMEGVSDAERAALVRLNAARLYGFDLPQ